MFIFYHKIWKHKSTKYGSKKAQKAETTFTFLINCVIIFTGDFYES